MPSVTLKFILHMCNMYRCDLNVFELAKYPNCLIAIFNFNSENFSVLVKLNFENVAKTNRYFSLFYFVLV